MRALVERLPLVLVTLSWAAGAAAGGPGFFLRNTGLDPDARAHFEENGAGWQAFEVKAEALAEGRYAVSVAGEVVGELSTGPEEEGRLVLRGRPLGFEPRGEVVEITSTRSAEVYFEAVLPRAAGGRPEKLELEEGFANTAMVPQAQGKAWLRSRSGRHASECGCRVYPRDSTISSSGG